MYKDYCASVGDKRQDGILLVILSEKCCINLPVTTSKNARGYVYHKRLQYICCITLYN